MTGFAKILLILSTIGFGYFVTNLIISRRQLSRMTVVERVQAHVSETRGARRSPGEAVRQLLIKNGITYGLPTAFTAWAVLTVGGSLLLRFSGFALPLAVIIAFLGACLFLALNARRAARNRRRLFNRQFLDALKLIANQLASGAGPQRAVEQVIPTLPEPLRTELGGAMDRAIGNVDMVDALEELSERYPSQALEMFVTALKINRASAGGGRLEPTIRRAGDIMLAQFELAQEATTELSQTKAEFWAVLGVIGLIGVVMIGGGGSQAHAAYTSLVGIIVLIVGAIWAALGIVLSVRLFNRARGDS